MKARTGAVLVLVIAAIGYSITACVSGSFSGGNDVSHNAVFGGHSIELPGTALSPADHEEMNRILARHHKQLYKVQSYDQAALKRTNGTLRDMFISKRAASQAAANVAKPGFTHDAIQIGVGEKPVPGHGSVPQVPASPSPMPGAGSVPQAPSPSPGQGSVPQRVAGYVAASSNPQVPPQLFNESAELVRELEPILKKYGGR
ncbi:MAG: hypothetical protein ACJ8KU_00480 [Chthoniobacterales bacterium]